jgi:hypothetical protein
METKHKRKLTEYVNRLQVCESRLKSKGKGGDIITVAGCGCNGVNGVYVKQGTSDFVPKYVHRGRYESREEEFTLYAADSWMTLGEFEFARSMTCLFVQP